MMRYLFIIAVCLGMGGEPAIAQTIQYELYEAAPDDEGSRILDHGVLEYDEDDFFVEPRGFFSVSQWAMHLPIGNGFYIGGSISPEESMNGFGLWIEHDRGGFSWDWFSECDCRCNESSDDAVFFKLQGPGEVSVSLEDARGVVVLREVEFLSDVTLRGRFGRPPEGHRHTHYLRIKEGSVLRFPSIVHAAGS